MEKIKVRKAATAAALEKMSARKLVALLEKIGEERRPICEMIINIGLGHVPINTLFDKYTHFAPVAADKELSDQQQAVRAECERRYGPDGLFHARYM